MKEILIATNNYGKVKEIEEILKGYKLFTLKDLGLKIEVKDIKIRIADLYPVPFSRIECLRNE